MTASQIASLLRPPDQHLADKNALAFLDSEFKTLDDLSRLEDVVKSKSKERDELNAQLSDSQRNIDKYIKETKEKVQEHLHTARELSLLRHSLADEAAYLSAELVSSLSNNDTGPTLLEDIETMQRNLKELESIKSYVLVVEHALKLSEASVTQISSIGSSKPITLDPLSTYQSLLKYVTEVSKMCSSVEGGEGQQSLNLVTFLQSLRSKTWSNIKQLFFTALETRAEKLRWPSPVDYLACPVEDRKEFEFAFVNLLRLQDLKSSLPDTPEESEGLYPIQALVHSVALRFKYHFEGQRMTNRLDKPEWYFTHVTNVIHEHRTFMEGPIQQLLRSTNYRQINAWREFTWLQSPMLSRKIKRSMPSLLPRPSLLAHTIYQALMFDAAMTEQGFELGGTSATLTSNKKDERWTGVSEVILGNEEWFGAWMSGEKKFTDDQYNAIISSPDAWLIANDDPNGEENRSLDLKSTNSARRVKALVEQITDRYSPLPSYSQKTSFLTSIQLPILEAYHNRISSSMDAFETLSNAFVRAVPGALTNVGFGGREEGGVAVDTQRLTSGVEGAQRLCKAVLSSQYVQSVMKSWEEDLFFLELWSEMNRTPELREQWKYADSLPSQSVSGPDGQEATIFQNLVAKYSKLTSRAKEMVVLHACAEIEGRLRPHFTALNSPDPKSLPSDNITLSQTLLEPIALLSSHITFLRTTLPKSMLLEVYKHLSSRLAEHILHRQILYRGQIKPREGQIVVAECELWIETCQAALSGALGGSRSRVESPWARLLEAARIVGADDQSRRQLKSADDWEDSMLQLTGFCDLTREEVDRVIRRCEDKES